MVKSMIFDTKKSVPFIEQSEVSECGLACLAMVACYHNHKTDLSTLRQQYNVSLKGATLNQIIEIAGKTGFSARAVRCDVEDLAELVLPAVLHWNMNHFVVLSGIKRGIKGIRYEIVDPSKGRRSFSHSEISSHFTGVALEIRKSLSFKTKPKASSISVSDLWSSIHGFWSVTRTLFILSLFLQMSALAAPFYLQIAIDSVLPSSDRNLLVILAIGFGALSFVSFLTNWLRSLTSINLHNSLSFHIVSNIFQHLMSLPLQWFEKRHVGDIVSRFGSTEPISQILSDSIVSTIIDTVMAIITIILMFMYSPVLATLAVLILAIYATIRVMSLQITKLLNVNAISASAKENTLLIESIKGAPAVKSFGQERNRQRIWQNSKVEAINASTKLNRISAAFHSLGSFIVSFEQVAFVFISVSLLLNGELTVGMIFAFSAYKAHFLDTGMRLVEQMFNFKMIGVHLGRISDIALSKGEGHHDGMKFDGDFESISVNNISYTYGLGEEYVLSNVNIDIRKNETVCFIGPSGGGKTTLLKILSGLIEPSSGAMALDSVPFSRFDKSTIRHKIGIVSQDDTLFAGTLLQNISFFDEECDVDRVIEASRIASIHDDIMSMPLGYHSLVGDMGSSLSGGQRQRIYLARALYKKPAILFMDEGTANLDPQTERDIISNLMSLSMTKIFVAHRPALINASDRVFVCLRGNVNQVTVQN